MASNLLTFATPGQFDLGIRRDSMDVLLFDENQLIDLSFQIFDELTLFEKFQIPKDVFLRFMQEIQKSYHTNPYHNFHHAIDVLHSCYLILSSTNITEYLTWVDVFALLFAALCHDIDHPGVNNNFLIVSQSPVALTYNDQAVLENHHCFHAFCILQKPGCNITSCLSPAEFKEFRKASIFAILSTDMGRHFEYLSKFATRLQTKPFSRESLDDRMFVMGMILHTADLGNVMRPPQVSREWSNRVMAEFLLQGDTEKDFGFPISPFMNRHETNPAVMSLNFLDFIAIPLVESMILFMPDLTYAYNNIKANRSFWFEVSRTEQPQLPVQYEKYDGMSIGLFSGSFWKVTISKIVKPEPEQKALGSNDGFTHHKHPPKRLAFGKLPYQPIEKQKATKPTSKTDFTQKQVSPVTKASQSAKHIVFAAKTEQSKSHIQKAITSSVSLRSTLTASISSETNDSKSTKSTIANTTRPNSAPV